jgi:hypothetical protein
MITRTHYIKAPDGLHELRTTYLDDDFNPVDRTVATQFHRIEVDSRGIPIGSSCGFLC